MKSLPGEAAKSFVQQYFPESNVAILAGSVAQNSAKNCSDLDIVIFDETQQFPFRKTYVAFGWKIEAFVLTKSSYPVFIDESRISALPSLLRMCAHGMVIKDDGSAGEIVKEAEDNLANGPYPWSTDEIDHARYEITECLEDLQDSGHRAENIFIVNKLANLVHKFILRINGRWIGDGKWAFRSIQLFNEQFGNEFVDMLETFYLKGETDRLIRFVDEMLQPYGGRLVEGFTESSYIPFASDENDT